MGQNFSSEPVVEKETQRDHNDTFNVAVSSCQGWRMSQEDNHSLMLELPGKHKAAFFAVYDGHGSARVSKHASEALWRHLVENENYEKGQFAKALEEAFLTFDREVNESYNAQLAGTTAVCLLIVDNVIHCANIGDSRGVACINCECLPLSYDHKPENPQELERILKAGGYVLGNRVNGNLALSRAFGDFHYKSNHLLPPEEQIVSPCPDVQSIELRDNVDFLVLACDGIWDVLSSEEVVEFVISRLEQSMEPGLICEQLTTRCLATDYELVIGCDNMTVLLVCYTRGRTWVDYCTDIFNKNTKRLGVPRTRPTMQSGDQQQLEDQLLMQSPLTGEVKEEEEEVLTEKEMKKETEEEEEVEEEVEEEEEGKKDETCKLDKNTAPIASDYDDDDDDGGGGGGDDDDDDHRQNADSSNINYNKQPTKIDTCNEDLQPQDTNNSNDEKKDELVDDSSSSCSNSNQKTMNQNRCDHLEVGAESYAHAQEEERVTTTTSTTTETTT